VTTEGSVNSRIPKIELHESFSWFDFDIDSIPQHALSDADRYWWNSLYLYTTVNCMT
jgi:hypothetical protein